MKNVHSSFRLARYESERRSPSLFFWFGRWFFFGLIGGLLFVGALFVANAIDYYPYYRAARLDRALGPEGLRKIADACSALEKQGHVRLEGDQVPAPFHALHPSRVEVSPGSTDIELYQRHDIYAYWRISTSPRNQDVLWFTNSGGAQSSRTLWIKRPEVAAETRPSGRIVTVSEDRRREEREWIVLPSEIRVVDRSWAAGGAETIVGTAAVSLEQKKEIETAIGLISGFRGHVYESGVLHGVSLNICFSETGTRADDIKLRNTWSQEVAPLLNAISSNVPEELAIDFQQEIQDQDYAKPEYQTVHTWEEIDGRERLQLPWWCIWPRVAALR